MVFDCVIIARMGSSRLPGKMLLQIDKESLFKKLVQRVRASKSVGRVILAIPDGAIDDPLAEEGADCGCEIFRGDPDDVLGRVTAAAKFFGCQSVIKILGDNPLIDPDVIDACAEQFLLQKLDFVASATEEFRHLRPGRRLFPVGTRIQIYTRSLLREINNAATSEECREHSSKYAADNWRRFNSRLLYADGLFQNFEGEGLNVSINTQYDLSKIRNVFSHFENSEVFSLADALPYIR